jgi:hypothetical protein
MFVRGANDDAGDASLGEKISVADFFAEKYQKLKYPNLPCIDGMSGAQKRANWLPMEAVKVCYFKIKTKSAIVSFLPLACCMGTFIKTIR